MRLPNLNALRMFDAAARHLNFRLAADELHLTQGAVAQQVRRLEADLGHKLFHRHARGLQLTDAGRGYHPPVRQALALIEDATQQLGPVARQVTLSVPPSFATKWLVPRMPAFDDAHPKLTLRVVAEEALTDFRADAVDIAIRQGMPPPNRETDSARLAPLALVAVASPRVAQDIGPLAGLRDLEPAMLIQDGHRHWDRLFRAQGLRPPQHVLRFNQTALAMDAAANGQGVALVPDIYLGAGQTALMPLWDAEPDPDAGFHIVWPLRHHGTAQQTVVAWLLAQAGASGSGADHVDH